MVRGGTRRQSIRPLDSSIVYNIGKNIQILRDAPSSFQMVTENEDPSEYARAIWELEDSLWDHGLALNEVQQLRFLHAELSGNYISSNQTVGFQHRQRLSTVIERIESSVKLEIGQRRFSEIKPAEGALDYSRLLSEGPSVLFEGNLYWETALLHE